jgi:hypothetical protein
MMKTKLIFASMICILSFFGVKGQTIVDTVKDKPVPVLYVVDSASFKTATGWCYKIVTSSYQFQQQQAAPGADSFTVKKVKVPVSVQYVQRLYVLGNTWQYKPIKVLAEFKNPYDKD